MTFLPGFLPHPKGDCRRRSVATLVKLVLSIKSPEVLPQHIEGMLDHLIWKYTEADGKLNLRYRTSGALACTKKALLRHEHVFQKAKMIDALVQGGPFVADTILSDAVACLVTLDEHASLDRFDHEYGWERYRLAGLEVHDLTTRERKV